MTDAKRDGDQENNGTPQTGPEKIEVIPADKNLEHIQALLASLIAPLFEGHRLSEEHQTTRMKAQLCHQLIHLAVGAFVVLVCIAIAAYFALSGLTQHRFEFAERIVYLIIGVGVGFLSGRSTR